MERRTNLLGSSEFKIQFDGNCSIRSVICKGVVASSLLRRRDIAFPWISPGRGARVASALGGNVKSQVSSSSKRLWRRTIMTVDEKGIDGSNDRWG